MRLLCISRKHPPSVGGMQRMNYELIRRLARKADCTVIKWGRSQALLPLFLIWALLRSLALIGGKKRPEVVYLGDSLLSPIGLLLKRLRRLPVAATAHGRDVSFRFPLYRLTVSFCLSRLDRVICVSAHTAALCRALGVSESRLVVVPNGVDCASHIPSAPETDAARKWLSRISPRPPGGPLILTIGRLVRRKGVVPFIRKTLPLIVARHPDLTYLVVGEGRERRRIEAALARSELRENVLLAGTLPQPFLRGLLGAADVFVMPNVSVPGDAEGFGLVALEAGCAGLPVVASDLEGIRDAIRDGENGFLVPPGETRSFAAAVLALIADPQRRNEAGERASRYNLDHFSWERCADRYMEELSALSQRGEAD